MKRIIICALCVLMLVACGNNKSLPDNITASVIVSEIVFAVGEEPKVNTSYVPKTGTFNTYAMSLWADGAYKECEEFNLLADYEIFYSADNSTYEISVLKAENQTDVSKLVDVLERRKQTLSQGDKAEYDPNFKKLMNDSKIITEGKFAILLITGNNDAAIKSIENLKQ